MIITNIRTEAASDRPSPVQIWADTVATSLDATWFCLGLVAPYRFARMLSGANRALVKALGIV